MADQRRVYLDGTAGLPTDPRVLEAMRPYFSERSGNPSSIHFFGREGRAALEAGRKSVGELVNAREPKEIVFTSCATESSNLAIKGLAQRNRSEGNHIVISQMEHMSVINTCKFLQKNGYEVTQVPPDKEGIMQLADIEKAMKKETLLVSVMWANNEIGTLQPMEEIGRLCAEKDVYFHSDAVAAAGRVPIDVQEAKVDLLSLSSNDIYGPKGVGALYVKEGTRLESILQGGGQERNLRSGSENIPGIVGFGAAADMMRAEMASETARLGVLRDKLVKGITSNIKETYLNGSATRRLPTNASIRFLYIEGESLILNLEMKGVAVSSGSACASKTLEPSHVLRCIGLAHEEAHGTLQFSLNRWTQEPDIDHVVAVLPEIVKRLRDMSPLTPDSLKDG
ncbi:MAG: cysteine desulfurase [Euryarchaeota archaeon]|nr:cysteine desulfurase [Euryarchaeota archaeon]